MFRPPSPAACRSPAGSRSRTGCGRPGGSKVPSWRREARRHPLLALKEQEDAGIDIVSAASRRASTSCTASWSGWRASTSPTRWRWASAPTAIRRWPQVVAPVRVKGWVHAFEAQGRPRPYQAPAEFTLPGPMTIADTIADRHYGDKVKMAFAFAELLKRRRWPWSRTAWTWCSSTSRRSTCSWSEVTDWASPPWAAPPRASSAPPRCTSATATASRPTWTGRRAWAASGARPGDLPSHRQEQHQAGVARTHALQGADQPDRPALGHGRAGGRHRRGERHDRDPRGGRYGGRRGRPSRAGQPHPALHQLRHGPHAAGTWPTRSWRHSRGRRGAERITKPRRYSDVYPGERSSDARRIYPY